MSKYKLILSKASALVMITFFIGAGIPKFNPRGTEILGDQIVAESIKANSPKQTELVRQLLAKAAPDECYDGIGLPYPPGPPCDQGIPKVNEAYVWGLTKTGAEIWFGTAANVHCAVLGGYLGMITPHETPSWVCEFGESQYSPPLPDATGDWRPPHIYRYDLNTNTLTDKSPPDPLFASTYGIRSAGSLGNMILLAGPNLLGGINIFAYEAGNGTYLGSTNLSDYTNIRKWLEVDGVLYTAVRNTEGGGNVLRWMGNHGNPFQFDVVGNLDTEGAELALHQGHIFVSTWPYLGGTPVRLAGIIMSPLVPEGGLTTAHADEWTKVWQSNDYEPDPVTAATYGGGALASFDGYLYWGTMHVPFVAALAHFNVYGTPETQLGILTWILNSHRAINIFRGRDFDTPNQEIELLYGERWLTVYNYNPDTSEGNWIIKSNNMNVNPLWGGSGFGNFYNNYTWTMDIFQGRLYVGTMDFSYLFMDVLRAILENLLDIPPGTDLEIEFPTPLNPGADLFYFSSANEAAIANSLDGIGNYSNYGIRTMLADDSMYLGSANPMNLMTDLTDDHPEGGWELIRMETSTNKIYIPILHK